MAKKPLDYDINSGHLPLQIIGEMVGVAPPTLRNYGLKQAGKYAGVTLYDAVPVVQAIISKLKDRGKTAITRLDEANIRKANAQAEKAEIMAKVARNEYVDINKVMAVWDDMRAIFTSTIQNAGKRLASKVIACKTEKDFIQLWQKWSEDLLNETKVNAERYLSGFEADDSDADTEAEIGRD